MSKIATRCADDPAYCISQDDGGRWTVKLATALGYSIRDAVAPAQAVQAHSTRDLIMALPEARGRPAAAAALASSETPLTLMAASSMLRGLPLETNEGTTTMATLSAEANAKFSRALDLRCAALRTSANNGSESASVELRKINRAKSTIALTGCSYGDAFTGAGLDARDLITQIVESSGAF